MAGDNKENDVSNAQIMHSIGKLVGTMEAMNLSVSQIREDIRRQDQTANDRLIRVEDNLAKRITDLGTAVDKRIDGLENRVVGLEAEDKEIIAKVAKMGALGGGVGGALVTAAVELIKYASK